MARAARATHKLAEYEGKRDFSVTPEPRGQRLAQARSLPLFVVQEHAASHLHYDFRLEHHGVLLSWAVPKGPSLRTRERRLAMRTEDHPLAYADFEGTIPEGEYGGGRVLVWDRGTWHTDADADQQLARGRLTFRLDGHKLRGRFHLVRSKGDAGRERWLLFKGADAEARDVDIVSQRPESVLTGVTIDQVNGRVWHAKGARKAGRTARARETASRGRPGASTPASSEDAAREAVVQAVSALKLGFPLTNLDRVLVPEQGLRKADLIAYHATVASRLLPHVVRRPLVLVRCPQGRQSKCFYQKHIDVAAPEVIRRIEIPESDASGEYGYIEEVRGLVALAQLGVLELHLWGCHVDRVESPDLFVFDLDPGEGLAWERVVEAALALRTRLTQLGLVSFVKTTGGKGLHVVAPVTRGLDWDEHKAVAFALVAELARAQPERYVTNMRKDVRKGKIFLDYLRNARGASAIAPYSPRAREGAKVATPITWQELEHGAQPGDFDVRAVIDRLAAQRRDPWQKFFSLKQRIAPDDVRALLAQAKRKAGR